MEQRVAKISMRIGPHGGSRIALPAAWVRQLGLSEEAREVTLQFDGESITIRPQVTAEFTPFLLRAQRMKHKLLLINYYEGERLCSKICADCTERRVAVENLVDNPVLTAFGVNQSPDWQALEDFLERRCVPRQRHGLRRYLEALGLDEYDPLEIIRKTEGRMAEDHFRVEIREG